MAGDPESWLNNNLDWFAHITPEAVEAALSGFPLQTEKSSRWFAGHIRRVHFSTISDGVEDYPGQTAVRQELEQISAALLEAMQRFDQRSSWAESVLRRFGSLQRANSDQAPFDDPKNRFSRSLSKREKADPLYQRDLDKHGQWAEGSQMLARVLPDWKAFRANVNGLYAMQPFIAKATEELCSKDAPARWRDEYRRKARISFASWLSPVYEVAYHRKATVNNWTNESDQPKLGPWPDFFNRVACIALKLDRIPDLSGILKEARKEYKNERKGIFSSDFPDENPP